MQRLLFLPTHWLSLGLRSLLIILAPIVFLWTGLSPVFNVGPMDVLYYFLPMALALSGGIWAFAPRQHFPLASMVQSTFLSFKILPSVFGTLVRPFGHPFKVTPKGQTSQASHYAGGIFWTSAALIGLTILGLTINTIPELQIINDSDALPVVAFWSAINSVVLFLVCLIALQAPLRRGEVRLELDEPIWVVSPSGTIQTGRTLDMSLSGAGFELDRDLMSAKAGDIVRVFITEVGFVAASVVRQSDRFMAVNFMLPASLERDLLIRKLFTAGLDINEMKVSTLSSTAAILKSIWDIRTEMPDLLEEDGPDVVVSFPIEKLAARSHVTLPRPRTARLADISAARRNFAA